MKWFKHLSVARNDEKIARLEDRCGLEGYGFYFKMLEIVAESVDGTDRCDATYSITRWARAVNISTRKWVRFTIVCSELSLISCETNSKLLQDYCKTPSNSVKISIPKLLKHRDNHTKNLQVTSKQEVEVYKEDRDKETTTVLLAGEDETFAAKNKPSGDDAPTQGMKWVEFFVNKIGFQIHEAQTAKTVPMFVQWEKLGVTVADVELAMIAAKRALNGSNPSNPVYYRRFVEQVMLEKQKSQEDQERTTSGLNSKNNGGTYVAKNRNNETRANSGKKLSLVEEGQLAIDRIEARELKKQAEHERIIN
jgi:hypothetical protein